MSRPFPNRFPFNHISHHNCAITSSCHEFGVILVDVEPIYVIVMDILVVFDEKSLGWVVQTAAL